VILAAVVDHTSFITSSEASLQAFKTATLLKTLPLNALIIGDDHIGKKALASVVLPDAEIIDGSDFDELLSALEVSKEIIISNLHNVSNFKTIFDKIRSNSVRVVATSKSYFNDKVYLDELFAIKIELQPLSKREEDVQMLIKRFVQESKTLFNVESEIDFGEFKPDLSDNSKSLRRQIAIRCLLEDLQEQEFMDLLESYLYEEIGAKNDYRKFLYLYEVPLLRSGLKKFNSQLGLSKVLGLNRNTLRKKIDEHKQYLEDVL